MDEVKITSTFTTRMISKLVTVLLKKKTGYDMDIRINEVVTTIADDGKVHAHLDVDADFDKKEFNKIMKDIGL